jgi:putative aldouronate transport system permease protein
VVGEGEKKVTTVKLHRRQSNRIKQSTGSRVFDVVNVIFMFLFLLITLYPFWYVLIISLSNGKDVMASRVSILPVNLTFATYNVVLSDSSILTGFQNTVLYTVVGTLINLIVTTFCAYPLSRPELPGKNIVMKLVVFTMFFSGGMIPTYLVVNQLGLIDTVWAMMLPTAISTYNMIVMRTFFMSIPESLHESARLDGANDLQILWRIVLPLSMPIMATMLLFYSVGHWNASCATWSWTAS